jgi:hypothetical protein
MTKIHKTITLTEVARARLDARAKALGTSASALIQSYAMTLSPALWEEDVKISVPEKWGETPAHLSKKKA